MSTVPTFPKNGSTGPFFPPNPGDAALLNLASMSPELMKRLYLHPDYQEVIAQNAAALLRQVERDPELLEALKRMFEGYGIPFDQSSERLEPVTTTIAIAFVAGAAAGMVIGWFSE